MKKVLIVIISVIVGVILSYKNNSSEFMSGSVVFMYFTIQSNIAIALIALIGGLFLVLNKKVSYVWYVIKLVGTVSITLTGMVFTFVLGFWLETNKTIPIIAPIITKPPIIELKIIINFLFILSLPFNRNLKKNYNQRIIT